MKNIVKLLTVLTLVFLMILPVFADRLDNVTDTTDTFTQSQWETLESKAEAISRKYNVGVYIILVDDYRNYSNKQNVWDAAVEIYKEYDLGEGSARNGAVLMLSLNNRDYAVDIHGSNAEYAFTEAGRDRMENGFLSYFRENDFYGGFYNYLETCERYLAAASSGTPIGYGEEGQGDYTEERLPIIAAVIPGAIAAILTGVLMSSSMHSAVVKTDANQYSVQGSMHLTRQSDMFLHRSVTRTPRQTNNSTRSGGSSGTHHSSGGHSGRSGKF